MSKSIQAIRGMNDILPTQVGDWQAVESVLRTLMASYAYAEIRCPVLEQSALFKRSIGDVTDIVEKEMYTFSDRNGDSLSLRPEGTAQIVRAALEHNLLYGQTPKLWSMGPMFRHERPQKGRYRQFYQCSAEAYGMPGPDIDAELIGMTAQLWQKLGVADKVCLEINSLGTPESREQYRAILIAYLKDNYAVLDEESKQRLERNPLRVLDSKNPDMADLIAKAPVLLDHLDEESATHFEQLQAMLSALGIAYTINPRLVRGLDYYTKTVFEWKSDQLGAQGTICGGGRYDGLIQQLGHKTEVPAVGFSIGLERLLLLRALTDPAPEKGVEAYVLVVGDAIQQHALQWTQQWRQAWPALKLWTHCGGGSFKSQFKKADKSGADVALILGEDEIQKGVVGVKWLRHDRPQQTIEQTDLIAYLKANWE